MSVKAFAWGHFANTVRSLEETDVMTAFALIGGESRNDATSVFANVVATPLVDGAVVVHSLDELVINVTFILTWGIVIFLVKMRVKVDDVVERGSERNGCRKSEPVVNEGAKESDNVNAFTILGDVAVFHGI